MVRALSELFNQSNGTRKSVQGDFPFTWVLQAGRIGTFYKLILHEWSQYMSPRNKLKIAIIFMALFFSANVWAEELKKPIAQSADKRFVNYSDGTTLDNKTGLLWMTQDYWQREAKWVNWYTANEYAQRMNNKDFAGHRDWRLPTPEEAATLYDRRKRNVDKDDDKIFIDSMFPKGAGWGTWTSAEKSNKAVAFSYKDEGGQAYQDKISGVDAFLRLVRNN